MGSKLKLGINFRGRYSIRKTLKLVKLAEAGGFEYAFVPEYYFLRDTVTQTAAYALNTRSMKLISMFNPYTRNPAVIAMSLASLNELAKDRVIACLGLSPKAWLEKMGMEQEKPSKALAECLSLIKRMLKGERIIRRGEVFRFNNVQLELEAKPIKVFLAVIGPRMLELAGKIGDGVVLTACTSLEYVRKAIRLVKMGLNSSGRNLEDMEIAACIAHISDRRYLPELKRYLAYITSLSDINVDLFGQKKFQKIKDSVAKGKIGEAIANLSDDDVEELALIGSPQECLRRLEDYLSANVTLPIITPIARPEEAIKLAETLRQDLR
jgi:5,10-methylenetetrahydromethanopterin reductase